MNDLMSLFEKNLLEHFFEQEAVSEKHKEEDYDEVKVIDMTCEIVTDDLERNRLIANFSSLLLTKMTIVKKPIQRTK